MDPNKHFILTKGLYSSKSIEQLCTIQIPKQIVTYLDIEKLELPSILKRNIQKIWKDSILYCDEQLPEDFEYEKIDLKHLSKTDVIALMQYDAILPFIDEGENHILTKYYMYHDDIVDSYFKRLCTHCAIDLKIHINRPSGWIHCSGKRLDLITYPQIYDAEGTMQEVIWNTEYWCDNCAMRPLFELIFNNV